MSYHAFAVVMVVLWSVQAALSIAQIWLCRKRARRERGR